MFEASIYKSRRQALVRQMQATGAEGIAFFIGYEEAPMNYSSNCYKFHQDSTFSYFWGIDEPGFAASLNLENGKECLYCDDVSIDDIVWMGSAEPVIQKAEKVGVAHVAPRKDFATAVRFALQNDKPVHFLPSSRNRSRLEMAEITGTPANEVYNTAPYKEGEYVHSSEELVRAVIELRLVKNPEEIARIDLACDLGVQMNEIALKGCRPGVREADLANLMDAFASANGWGVSFATILSQNGQILHGHDHSLTIENGRLLLVDAGLALEDYYCSDFTRTYPCGGHFSTQQKEIYDIVEGCNAKTIELARPGVEYRDVHIIVCKQMLEGLKALGLLTGNIDDMSAEGICGMFMPHGLGHNIGLDVHDMEDLGENYVGYTRNQSRDRHLGLGSLRMARPLVAGNVISDEPGIYFIPALWEYFRRNKMDKGFVNFDKLQAYANFGGIRLEDDLLITPDGCRLLGTTRLPIKSEDVETRMKR